MEKVKKFLQDGLGYTRGPKNSPCSLQFTKVTVLFNLNNSLELSSGELDLVIVSRHSPELSTFDVKGVLVALSITSRNQFTRAYLCFYGITYSRFQRLKEHYQKHSIPPQQHGNTKRLPENALPQSTIEHVH